MPLRGEDGGDFLLGSLFSGIGGLDLGVEHATGGRVVWQVEVDPFCSTVLGRHWPDAVRYGDVRACGAIPWRHHLARVDGIIGGFPCQDLSLAGKQAGLAGERSGLWREYRRIVAELRPGFVFVENVPGLLTADRGHAFGEVAGDLAALGYDLAWDLFRASDLGAPHRRERVFLLAHRGGGVERWWQPERLSGGALSSLAGGAGEGGLADPDGLGRGRRREREDEGGRGEPARGGARVGHADGDGERGEEIRGPGVPAQPGLGGRADGLSAGLDGHRWPAGRGEAPHPWEPPRVLARVHKRGKQLKAYGNAVVPIVASVAWRVLFARLLGEG